MATLASGTELVSRVGSQRSAFNGAPLRPADALRSMRASRVRSCHVARAVIADASSSKRQPAFSQPKPVTSLEQTLGGLSNPAFYGVSAALVATAAAVGSVVGGVVSGNNIVKGAGAVLLGAGGAAAAVSLSGTRDKGAGKEIFNSLVGSSDPISLVPQVLATISSRYGGVNVASKFNAELQEVYDQYIISVLPQGAEPLKGWEMDAIRSFKDTLSLEDKDAAQVHLEIGRRIFRGRLEVGDKESESGQRKEFQKLVFISTLVFGEAKARFLLPWKRVFQVTDAQVNLALRDNAARLFKEQLDQLVPNADADTAKLAEARAYQQQIALPDDAAAEIFQAAARNRVESAAKRAADVLKNRTRVRDVSAALSEIEDILAYNRSLKAVAGNDALVPGVGPVTLFGGAYDVEANMQDLRDLFRMYVAENIKDGTFADATQAALGELRTTFGMGAKEADAIVADVSLKVYRMALRQALADGRLAAASSPAKFLQELCDALKFPPPSAEAVNVELYRSRLDELMKKERLTDDDDTELQALRKQLCIPVATDAEARREVCGEVYKKVVRTAMEAGTDGFSLDLLDKVKRVKEDVKLDDDAAVAVIGELAKKVFLALVRDSRNKANRLDAAKELKNIVMFNQVVVTPLVKSVRGAKVEAAAAEIAELLKEAKAAAAEEEKKEAGAAGDASTATVDVTPVDDVASMNKVEAAVKAEAEAAQKEITLAQDLPLNQRQELYRTFLLYCLTGDQVYAPMGTTITIERDQSEFARLSQLGEVLGMNMMEVADVHRGLAEQAFRSNAENILADGMLTSDKKEKLDELQKQLGLPAEVAQKVITGITSGKLTSNVQAQIATGKLTLEEIEALSANGVDVEQVIGQELRLSLYRKEVERQLTSGSGKFDTQRMLEKGPAVLKLEAKKVQEEVGKIAAEKKRNQLVQAVSFLRQKNREQVFRSASNLVACAQAAPGGAALEWPVKEELMDVYSVMALSKADGESLATLGRLLGLDDATRQRLEEVVAQGGFKLEQEQFKEALY